MFGLFTKRYSPIAIDCGNFALKMVQLAINGNALELQAAASFDVPDQVDCLADRHEWQISMIKQALSQHPFKGKKAAMTLPGDKLYIQQMKVEKTSEMKQQQQIQYYAQQKVPFSLEHALLHHISAGSTANDREHEELILLAADQETIAEHLDIAERAHLNIESITIPLPALTSALAVQLAQAPTTLLADIGRHSVKVTICDGLQPRFYRQLNFDGTVFANDQDEQLDERIDNNILQQKALNHLKNELLNCIRFDSLHFERPAPQQMILTGGLSCHNNLASSLAQTLKIETYRAQAQNLFTVPTSATTQQEPLLPSHLDWNTAIGLCLMTLSQMKPNATTQTHKQPS